MKFGLSNPSLSHTAFWSHGVSLQGSGTIYVYNIAATTEVSKFKYVLEQLNPSPSVKGSTQVQLKFELSNPSLLHTAFSSQGLDRQGSGTTKQ